MEGLKFYNLSNETLDQQFLEFLVGFLKTVNIQAVVEKIHGSASWPELQKRMTGSRAALLNLTESQKLVGQMVTLPTETRLLGCADCLFYQDGAWWPRLNLKDAMHELIVKKARTLDINESAYIIGEGAMLRVMASLVVGFGFSRVHLVGLTLRDAEDQRDRLKKNFMGIDWRTLDISQLTMQTDGGTIMVNALPVANNVNLMNDLAYFNFMKNDGLIIDLNVFPLESPLVDEAVRAQLRTLSGFQVRAQQDYGFLHRLGLDQLISLEDFSEKWLAYLRGIDAKV